MKRKLALYNDQLIPANARIDERLMSLIGRSRPSVGHVAAGRDPRGYWFQRKAAYYAALGARLTEAVVMAAPPDAADWERLAGCDAIHLSGGNTFYFLRALRARGWLPKLREYVANGGVLIGVSAGAIMMTPEISSARLCGDRKVRDLDDLSALALVDFSFAPHFTAGRGWMRKLGDHARRTGRVVHGCSDGDGIIVDGDTIEPFGKLAKVEP